MRPQLRTTCPICDAQTEASPATIAGFLIKICQLESETTNSRYCKKCDFVFFERRLSGEEAGRLYHDYRGEQYNRLRESVEPGYMNLATFMEDELGDYYVKRINSYANLLRLFPEINTDDVLDFGGDGKLAGRVFTNSNICFDDLSAGRKLNVDQFDIIFASQVFEHLSDVRANMINLSQRLKENGLVIVDVPKEYDGSLSEAVLRQATHVGSLRVMHEHINHYSLKAIEELVKSAGLVPFFTILLPPFRTIFTIAGRPTSKLLLRLKADSIQRQLLWYAQINLQNTLDTQATAEQANLEAKHAHFYAREAANKLS